MLKRNVALRSQSRSRRSRLALWAFLCLFAPATALPPSCPAGADEGGVGSASSARTNRHLVFELPDLPDGLEWTRNEDPELIEAGIAEFMAKGYTSSTSPVRCLIQKLPTDESPASLRDQVLAPLKHCPGHRVEEFRGAGRHPERLDLEARCPKLGRSDHGVISLVSLFKDSDVVHIVVGEARIAPPEGEARAERLAELLRETMRNIRSCDAENNCL